LVTLGLRYACFLSRCYAGILIAGPLRWASGVAALRVGLRRKVGIFSALLRHG
jgi:hypothetical protein